MDLFSKKGEKSKEKKPAKKQVKKKNEIAKSKKEKTNVLANVGTAFSNFGKKVKTSFDDAVKKAKENQEIKNKEKKEKATQRQKEKQEKKENLKIEKAIKKQSKPDVPKKVFDPTMRYNILTVIVYLSIIALLLFLFNLQILNGLEYRKKSTARLLKEVQIEPTRGQILDRTGMVYASNILKYNVEVWKVNQDNNTKNVLATTLYNILKENNETYENTLPITFNSQDGTYVYNKDENQIAEWKKEYNIPKEATAKEAFEILKEEYQMDNKDPLVEFGTVALRYTISSDDFQNQKIITLAKGVSKKTAIQIQESNFLMPGINIKEVTQRDYPQNNNASHVVGYISRINEQEYEERKDKGYKNDDKIGKTGIEKTFEEVLKGTYGTKQIEMNINGQVASESIIKNAHGGADIVLTLDSKLQAVTQSALEKMISKLKTDPKGSPNVKGGSCVVMNVKTGEVLAMANYPDYNPNDFLNGISMAKWKEYNNPLHPLVNRAIQGTYSPASTYKMLTAIAALTEKVTNENEYINDTGIFPKAHKPKCWIFSDYGYGHGPLNVVGAIKNSCNYYFYEMGLRLGLDKMEKYAKYFGLGAKTGVELINEQEGVLSTRGLIESKGLKVHDGDTLSTAIGQSYNSFTPLQIAKYISMVANGGIQIEPTIIKSVTDSNGKNYTKEEVQGVSDKITGYDRSKKEENPNISKETMQTIKRAMKTVVDSGTAASSFKGFDVEMAGKTGTAQAGADTNALFVGFAPYNDPEIAIVIVIENGKEGYFIAGATREIVKEYFGLNIENIKEDMRSKENGEYIM